jgi:protein-tyrosine phosphatase
VIDLHCHILPGIDDGPTTIEDSLALARAAVAAGIATIVATPHVNGRYPSRADTIAQLVEELNTRLRAEGIVRAS